MDQERKQDLSRAPSEPASGMMYQQSFFKSKTVWFLLAIVIFGLTGCKPKVKKKKERPIALQVQTVERMDLPEHLIFTGNLDAEAQVQLFSTIPDRIAKQYVEMNQKVKKNQKLAMIEHTRLKQVEAQVRAQIASTRSQLAGAFVNLAGAKVAEASMKREYLRAYRLWRRGALGKQQVDLARVQKKSATTRVKAARVQIEAAKAQIKVLRASLAQARTARKKAIVRAPFDGIVARRHREVGELAVPQLPLFTIVQMDRVKVKLRASEVQFRRLRLYQRAELEIKGYPGRVFVGKITKIAPTFDLDTRTAPFEVEFENIFPKSPTTTCKSHSDCGQQGKYSYCTRYCPSSKNCSRKKVCAEKHPLKPGILVRVRIQVQMHKNTVRIPFHAILNTSFGYEAAKQQKNLSVLVLGKNNQPKKVAIKLGFEAKGGTVQVLSGLDTGHRLIVAGHNMYKKGAKITILDGKKNKAPVKGNKNKVLSGNL